MYRITYALGALTDAELAKLDLSILLETLARVDEAELAARRVPPLSASGVIVEEERPPALLAEPLGARARESWQDVYTSMFVRQDGTRRAGNASLAAWRVAELRRRGVDARARIVTRQGANGIEEWRAVVGLPNGEFEDPSRDAGWTPVADVNGRLRITFVLDLFQGAIDEATSHEALAAMLEGLTAIDVMYLQRHPETPDIFKSGVRYMEEPPGQEEWQDVPTTLRLKYGDCEDLASWLAASMFVKQGVKAPAIYSSKKLPSGAVLYHIRNRFPTGEIFDVSKALGMR